MSKKITIKKNLAKILIITVFALAIIFNSSEVYCVECAPGTSLLDSNLGAGVKNLDIAETQIEKEVVELIDVPEFEELFKENVRLQELGKKVGSDRAKKLQNDIKPDFDEAVYSKGSRSFSIPEVNTKEEFLFHANLIGSRIAKDSDIIVADASQELAGKTIRFTSDADGNTNVVSNIVKKDADENFKLVGGGDQTGKAAYDINLGGNHDWEIFSTSTTTFKTPESAEDMAPWMASTIFGKNTANIIADKTEDEIKELMWDEFKKFKDVAIWKNIEGDISFASAHTLPVYEIDFSSLKAARTKEFTSDTNAIKSEHIANSIFGRPFRFSDEPQKKGFDDIFEDKVDIITGKKFGEGGATFNAKDIDGFSEDTTDYLYEMFRSQLNLEEGKKIKVTSLGHDEISDPKTGKPALLAITKRESPDKKPEYLVSILTEPDQKLNIENLGGETIILNPGSYPRDPVIAAKSGKVKESDVNFIFATDTKINDKGDVTSIELKRFDIDEKSAKDLI